MKASELIRELQDKIDQYGDLDIFNCDDEWGGPMYPIRAIDIYIVEHNDGLEDEGYNIGDVVFVENHRT